MPYPDDILEAVRPPLDRPLLGLTLLAVEDSRFACEGLRLLCLRSGARLRRADSLGAAGRHLATYRPGAVLVDLGLPDGSGADLIARLAAATARVEVILGMSGDPAAEAEAMGAGADGFMGKPILGLAAFQAAILAHLPPERRPRLARIGPDPEVVPAAFAWRDDLSHAATLLGHDELPENGVPRLDYAARFVAGLAHSAGDAALSAAADAVMAERGVGHGAGAEIAHLKAVVQTRLALAPTA